MGKRVVSAVELSNVFAKRFKDMYPLSRVTGFEVRADGGGEWLAIRYLGHIEPGTTTDAANLLQSMKAEFLIDE